MQHATTCRQHPFGGQIPHDDCPDTLHVCGTDLGLFESEAPSFRGPQRCACRKPQEPDVWEGWDVAEAYRLCDACGQTLLHSGSRFSVWFCRACLDELRRVEKAMGGSVVPIARHTVMSGNLLLLDGRKMDPTDARGTCEALLSFIDLIRRLERWKKAWMEHLYRRVARSGEASLPVGEFLRRVAALDERIHGPRAGVLGLLTWFGVQKRRGSPHRLAVQMPEGPPRPVLPPRVPPQAVEADLLQSFTDAIGPKEAEELRRGGPSPLASHCFHWAFSAARELPLPALRPYDVRPLGLRDARDVRALCDAAQEAFVARFGEPLPPRVPELPEGVEPWAATEQSSRRGRPPRGSLFAVSYISAWTRHEFHVKHFRRDPTWDLYLVENIPDLGGRIVNHVAQCDGRRVTDAGDAVFFMLEAWFQANKAAWGLGPPGAVESCGVLSADLAHIVVERVWGPQGA